MNICKHCKQEFTRNKIGAHVRWCDLNPAKEFNRIKLKNTKKQNKQIPWNKGKKWADLGYNTKLIFKSRKGRPGRPCSNATKELLRQRALASSHRRLVRSQRIYKQIDGKEIVLDSSWEELLARRLDKLNIKWERPGPIVWFDRQNISHNYFPDFYLIDYNIYLDPKNPIAYKVQIEKINCLKEQIPNLVFLLTENEIKTFNIASVCRLSSKQEKANWIT